MVLKVRPVNVAIVLAFGLVVCVHSGIAAAQNPSAPDTAVPVTAERAGVGIRTRDAEPVPPMRRLVSLHLRDVPLERALDELDRQASLGLTYSPRLVPTEHRITISRDSITVQEALALLLERTDVMPTVTSAGKIVLVRQPRRSEAPPETVVGIVYGTVTDSASGEPVPNVIVIVKGTPIRASTGDRGQFQLREVPSGEQVVITRLLGYLPLEKEITVMDDRLVRLDFALRYAPARLQEVVTTATGNRRRLEIGNDITVLNADSIVATQPVASVTDLLEGRVPGLVVQRTSGAPGDPARLRLRGVSSPRLSNDPIVIVDGVRVYSEQSDGRGENLAGTGGTTYSAPSPLDYIDPNSIETLEVLKGPSAATLYGQDAANGVIVVTTKKGKEGPARWRISTERGMSEMGGSYPDLLLRWGRTLTDDARVFCPVNNHSGGGTVNPACQADSVVAFQLLSDPALTVLDKGSHTAMTGGVSGGSSMLTYSVTGSYRDEVGLVKLPGYEVARYRTDEGTDPPDWMQRPQALTQWGGSSRITAQLGSKADVSLSANLSRTEQRRSELERQLGSLMSTYLDRASGTYYARFSGGRGLIQPVDDRVLANYHERATAVATQFTNGANLNWRPVGWLTSTADAGLNVIQRGDEILLPIGYGSGSQHNGQLRLGQGTSVTSTVNLRARARVPVGAGFQLQLATGINYTGRSINDLTGGVTGLSAGTESPNNAASITSLRQTRSDQATFGWYVEPSMSHKRLWLSTGLRFDGGSTFGNSLSLQSFPKMNVSYLVSDERFFPFKNLIPELRLRVAYGQAGRQPGPTDRLRLYSSTIPTLIDGQVVGGVMLETLGNTQLKPERTTEFEGGFDAGLLNDRLTLTFTGYRKTTRDALLSVPLPPSVYGRDVTILENIGVIRNTGLETTLGAQLLRTDPITWGVQFAVSQQRNEVVQLGPGVESFYTETTPNLSGGIRVAAGYPLFGRWAKPILGYADTNENGVLEREEVLLGDTAVFVGGTLPNYTANLSTTVSLLRGALAVSAGFLYEDGMTQRNEIARDLSSFSRGWNVEGASLEAQAATIDADTEYNWIQTVSTLRFNSLAVTYNVPIPIAQRFRARALSLSLQGVNLGIRTNYRGLDPHVNAHATGNNVTDTGVLPRPRTWQLRLNATY